MIDVTERMLFAVPKKGRLYEESVKLLKKTDFQYKRKARLDIALCKNFEIGFLFLPAKDIPIFVGEGKVDVGITGQDVIAEAGVDVEELLPLGFGKCRLCVQAPVKNQMTLDDIIGKRIVTSFPRLTEQFMTSHDSEHKTQIRTVSGSVEVACSLGLADGIVDLVESGDTMKAAGLEIIKEMFETQAVLIANKNSKHQDLIHKIQRRFAGVITAEQYAMIEYNIERSKLSAGESITPGRKSPTISPLEDPNWVAVKSMIKKSDSNILIEKLENAGATDILVYGIDNCRV
ncbi:MAG: ATP phosphoribosyltransferase [bacterium]